MLSEARGIGIMLRHKFKAKPIDIDGYRFPSKKEGAYYQDLKLKQKAGLVVMFLRQVGFHLPGGVKYILDFMEFHADGSVQCVDTKGYKTPEYKAKKKLVEALYPITIIEK
jgi:hypothetical protein